MRRLFAAAAVGFMVVGSAAFAADERDFTIVNSTGYPIKFIGINPPGDEVWNENELNGIMGDGSTVNVKFSGADKGCVWNMKVTWADDNTSSYFRNMNLCKISNVELKYNRQTDTASYTWN